MNEEKGFTLIELIGVLAIMAILASAIAPNLAKEISRSMAEAEDNSLSTLSEALTRSVVDLHSICGTAAGQWNNTIAPYCNLPSQQILQNRGTGTRQLLVRPTNDLGGLPYDQRNRFETGGAAAGTLPSTAPMQGRLLLISSLATPLVNFNPTNAQFDAIWEQAGTIPAGYKQSDKFRLERIGFASLFYPVTISVSSIAANPRWSVDNSFIRDIPVSTFTVYLILGTRVNLYLGPVQTTTIVANKPLGITYDGISWRY
jgi:prepilin-type N-terminal cleavage/methylation domain-containing protein